jgi:hypothetical protein
MSIRNVNTTRIIGGSRLGGLSQKRALVTSLIEDFETLGNGSSADGQRDMITRDVNNWAVDDLQSYADGSANGLNGGDLWSGAMVTR